MSEVKRVNGRAKYPAGMKILAPAVFGLPACSGSRAAAKKGFSLGSGSAKPVKYRGRDRRGFPRAFPSACRVVYRRRQALCHL